MNHHEGMNHDDMGHGGMDHGGMDMGGCSPQMLWNADYKATCIIHPAFRIHNVTSLIFYMAVLFAIGICYEYSRLLPARLESALRSGDDLRKFYKKPSRDGHDGSRLPLLGPNSERSQLAGLPRLSPGAKALRSALYTLNVAVSFFLMLVIMTYNAYLILAVLAGAFAGHYLFHESTLLEMDRGMACH